MMTPSLQSVITDFAFCNNIPIFVIEKDKEMETTIIRIGNSRGIIIPSALLKKYKLVIWTIMELSDLKISSIYLNYI